MSEREQLMADLKRINDKLDALEESGRQEEWDAYFRKNRWVANYDSKGNWVGHVANESGWHP